MMTTTMCYRLSTLLSLILCACGALHAQTHPVATMPTVAVLDTEVRHHNPDSDDRPMPLEEARQLQQAADLAIWSSLSERDDVVLVDRSSLQNVLDEKALQATAMGSSDAERQLAGSLRAAGVLVVPVINAEPYRLSVQIETVSAATGQLLGELWISGKPAEREQMASRLQGELPALWRQTCQTLNTQRDFPLVEVTDARLIGGDARLQWLADDLADRLRAAVGMETGAVLLRPRQAISTKEERLLAVMGLSRVGEEDTSGWVVAPDMRVRVEIHTKPAERLTFDQTPLRIDVAVTGNGDDAQIAVESTVAEYEAHRAQAVNWLGRTIRARSVGATVRTPEEDEAIARTYAQQELAAVRELAGRFGDHLYHRWNLNRDQQLIRWRVLQHALRAAHLDPTSEEAARYIALTVDSEYFLRGQQRSQACVDRTIAEGRRYLERFPSEVAKHNTAFWVHRLVSTAAFHRLMTLRPQENFVVKPYDPEVYSYSRIYLNYALPVNRTIEIYRSNLNGAAYILRDMLMHCPPELREAEHRHWRDIWEKQVLSINGPRLRPWAWIEMGYWAGCEDYMQVRRCYEALARDYPRSDENIWGSSQLRPDGKPHWKDWMEKFLKRAGDPEWETWEPGSTGPSDKLYVNIDDWRKLLRRLYPPLPQAWEYEQLPRAKARRTLRIPDPVIEHGKATRYWWATASVEIMAEIDRETWLIAPGLDRRDINQGRVNHRLFRLLGDEAVEVPWPATASEHDASEERIVASSFLLDTRFAQPTVLVGTYAHGLARFSRQDSAWVGEWINLRSGLPGRKVAQVRPCTYGGKPMWLVTVETAVNQAGGKPWAVCVIDPTNGQVTILHRTSTDMHLRPHAMALWPGVAAVPVHHFDSEHWPELDWAEAQFLDEPANGRQYMVLPGADGAPPRVLFTADQRRTPEWWEIGECDPVTGEVIGRANGGGRRESVLIGTHILGGLTGDSPLEFAWRLGTWSFHAMPPRGDFECATGADGVIWMAIPGGQNIGENHRALVGYRPAPQGSRNWRKADEWIGPFRAPDGRHITGLLPDSDGGLWVSTAGGGVFNLSVNQLLETAEQIGTIQSSSSWRQRYERRITDRGWRQHIRLLTSTGDIAAIEHVLNVQDQADALDVALYRAVAYGNSPQPEHWEQSARIYEQVITHPDADPAAKMLAFCNRILVLRRSGRWRDLSVTIDAYRSLFPQADNSTMSGSHSLLHIARETEKKLSEAEDPDSSHLIIDPD